ncbi:MAG: oxidoreductase [Desulfovibrionaceae bacterium CG1_02_65_16]|nr:MAG: oxidoreductase [Desulfovibrionaceae bacterium CG1_02_65_16]
MQKVGVIGLGSMGKIHLRNYCEMPDVEVVGVMDVAQANLDEAKNRFGVAGFTNLAELLKRKPDAVSISVPTVLHYEVALEVIEHGVALLVEKPLAATAEQGWRLVEAARAKGVALMVGHIERFNPAVQRVKELAGDDLISLSIERVGPFPVRIQDVGVIRDLGSHDIDLLRFLTGSNFKTVSGVFSTSQGKHEDSALITAKMENGVLAHITTNWVTPFRSRTIRAACKSRFIVADLMTQQVREYGPFSEADKTYSVREWPAQHREQMREELTQFLRAVREKTPPPITGEDGLAVLEVIERIFAGA